MKLPLVIIADDFFNDPLKIRNAALALQFSKPERTNYPGERTGLLHEVAPEIYKEFLDNLKEYSELSKSNSIRIDSMFQLIESSSNPDLNLGWIHQDFPTIMSGVIYLNTEPDPNSGTVLVSPKAGTNPTANAHFNFRNSYYDRLNNISDSEFVAAMKKHNSKFEVDLNVTNKFNRLVTFDASKNHSQNGYAMLNGEARLTLVFFIHNIEET
jgi:hypothetical protein